MEFDISTTIAGVGLFLLGMMFLEESLRKLAGRTFKIFLRKQTDNKFKAVAGGAIVTGVLQSSSVVNLMVLAFVGAGILTMQNALAVILGANIGTTLTSWIVATIGFKINIEAFAFPIVGVFGITMALAKKDSVVFQWSKFLFGFGALFVGLSFMKSGFEHLVGQMDFSNFGDQPLAVFILIGFGITTVIQSSSATVAITLTALHSGAIGLFGAMAMVLGSEVGTTIKLLLASLGGVAAKKRVAFGNFIYNGVMIVLIMIALTPLRNFIVDGMNVKDDLIALVVFQSGINILGVVIFFPFLNIFGKFLSNRFANHDQGSKFIKAIPPTVGGDLGLDAVAKETKGLLILVVDFVLNSFGTYDSTIRNQIDHEVRNKSTHEKYDLLKLIHGEVHNYVINFNKGTLDSAEAEYLDRLASAVRNGMFAAKSIKDSMNDIDQFKNSSNNSKFQYYHSSRESVREFYRKISDFLTHPATPNVFEDMVNLYNEVHKGYNDRLNELYKSGMDTDLSEMEVSTLINYNRELYSSHKAIVWATKDFLLNHEQGKYFSELPGFIR
ncbi:MAG: Na/Pi symporter [Cyclobacteriaceae bacterium]|nr:Na/Pi cotransporter family protein [Cyclobacteriaceae bacterium]